MRRRRVCYWQTAVPTRDLLIALRIHERDPDIGLHDVSHPSDAFVRRFRCRQLVLPQDVGLPAWHDHQWNMALPNMVVDEFEPD